MIDKKYVKDNIEKNLNWNCTPTNKRFCLGYITSLADTEFINRQEFLYLLNTIGLWKKGDTHSKMVTPDSMC